MKHLTTAKAGDQVRPIPTGFLANGLYTVKEVRLISGAPWLFLVGLDSMFAPEFFLPPEPRYSESFTKRAVAEPTTGHVADSPIQKHSLGDIYPLAVVGYATAKTVTYVVENLCNGTVLMAPRSYVRQWMSAKAAEDIARKIAAGATHDQLGDLYTWRKGRPEYTTDDLLALPVDTRATRIVLTKEEKLKRIDEQIVKLQKRRYDIENDLVEVKAKKEVVLKRIDDYIAKLQARRYNIENDLVEVQVGRKVVLPQA